MCLCLGPSSELICYLVEFGVQRATELHVLDQVGALALIWGDDANLIWLCPSLQQPGCYFLHIGSLSSLN